MRIFVFEIQTSSIFYHNKDICISIRDIYMSNIDICISEISLIKLNSGYLHLKKRCLKLKCIYLYLKWDIWFSKLNTYIFISVRDICISVRDICIYYNWIRDITIHSLASVTQLNVPSDWRPGGRGFNQVGNILSWRLIMKYFLR